MSVDILDRQVRRTQNVIDATLQENEASRHILAQWLTATPSREDGGQQEQQQEKALFPRCATAASTTRGNNHHRTCPPFRSGTPPPSSSSSVGSDPNGFLFEGLRRSLQKPLSSSSGSFCSLPPTPAALPVKVKKDGKGNAVPSTSSSAMGRSLETETELLPAAAAGLHHVAPPVALGLFERLLYRVAYSTVDSFLPCETLYRQVLQYLPLQLSERFFRLSLGVSLVAVAVEADRSDRVSAVDVLLSQVEPSVWSRADRHEIFRHLYAFTVWHLVYHSTASWCSQWRQQSTQGERAAPTSAVVEGRGSCSPSFSPHHNDAAASLKMIQYFTNSEEVHIRLPPEVQEWAMWRAGVAEVSVQVLTLALAALRRCRANRSLNDELWHSGYVSTLRSVVRIPKADPFSSPIREHRKHKPQPQEATNDDDDEEAARMMKVEPHHHHSHHREPHDESLSSLLDRSLRIVQRQETSKQNREAVEEGKSFSRRTRLEHHTRRLGTALPTALLQRRTVSSSLDAHRSRAALMTADQSVLFERRREQGARTASNAKGQQAAIDARRRQRYLSSLPIETMVLISWV